MSLIPILCCSNAIHLVGCQGLGDIHLVVRLFHVELLQQFHTEYGGEPALLSDAVSADYAPLSDDMSADYAPLSDDVSADYAPLSDDVSADYVPPFLVVVGMFPSVSVCACFLGHQTILEHIA